MFLFCLSDFLEFPGSYRNDTGMVADSDLDLVWSIVGYKGEVKSQNFVTVKLILDILRSFPRNLAG